MYDFIFQCRTNKPLDIYGIAYNITKHIAIIHCFFFGSMHSSISL